MSRAQSTAVSAGVVILQWLTYAFWGWTLLSIIWLLFIVWANLLTVMDTSDMVPYAIAATIVLLPISVVCDVLYGRKEPAKKTGASMVVMVIHAVLFALCGIGLLISAVLTLVQMMIGSVDSSGFQQVWLATSLIATVLYAVTFLRTLNPSPKLRMRVLYPSGMAVVTIVFIVLGFIGPVAQASLTRDDRALDGAVVTVSQGINDYVRDHGELPRQLSDIQLIDRNERDSDVINKGLIDYRTEGPVVQAPTKGIALEETERIQSAIARTEYRYQLCVEYKAADRYNSSSRSFERNNQTYSSYLSTYGHPAGKVCYKVQTNNY
ncbi:MAG: hypothetical protein WAS27_01405 [Candidatus Saccharimonadales bacterium]